MKLAHTSAPHPDVQPNVGRACLACRCTHLLPFFQLRQVPVHCNRLAQSQREARTAPLADLDLVLCRRCGHVYNRAFDPRKMRYDDRYETSLHFSDGFARYADTLASELIGKYELQGKSVVEVGCGQGEFLQLLCRKGAARGVGFEPSRSGSPVKTADPANFGRVKVVGDYFTEHSDVRADLVCCRHVLEHLEDPGELLRAIRENPGVTRDSVVFFEVPSVRHTLCNAGFWDVIYEHCSYFSAVSLRHVFEQAGMQTLGVSERFGGQFLCIEARPSNRGARTETERSAVEELEQLAGAFRDAFQSSLCSWRTWLRSLREERRRVVVWGAGSKGVSFVNLLSDPGLVDFLVDISPRKVGLYVPGTGHRVLPPAAVRDSQTDVVLVMNRIYQSEVEQKMRELGVNAELRCL